MSSTAQRFREVAMRALFLEDGLRDYIWLLRDGMKEHSDLVSNWRLAVGDKASRLLDAIEAAR